MTEREIAATCHAAWEMVGRVGADIWRARRELDGARKVTGPGATAGHLDRAEVALSVAAIELKSALGQVAAARAAAARAEGREAADA